MYGSCIGGDRFTTARDVRLAPSYKTEVTVPRTLKQNSPVESIPPPEVIRQRLSNLVREASLLRRLLRLAEAKRSRDATKPAVSGVNRGRS